MNTYITSLWIGQWSWWLFVFSLTYLFLSIQAQVRHWRVLLDSAELMTHHRHQANHNANELRPAAELLQPPALYHWASSGVLQKVQANASKVSEARFTRDISESLLMLRLTDLILAIIQYCQNSRCVKRHSNYYFNWDYWGTWNITQNMTEVYKLLLYNQVSVHVIELHSRGALVAETFVFLYILQLIVTIII